ncbi:MAG: class I SAM-dependent methyltransferase [Coriobacteriia bacterium]|nr:class I SAM-dependent methyltransferase [Coriobacteriia bacterium]
MNQQVALQLAELNTRFYAEQAASFSSTRQSPWPGWRQVADLLVDLGEREAPMRASVSLLDLACGNLRFERFLADERPQVDWRMVAVDNCVPLMDAGASADASAGECVAFAELDAVGALVRGDFAERLDACAPQSLDASVSFGFLHHVPGFDRRAELLRALVNAVRPGGLVAVSLWRFMGNPKLAEKARATTEQALRDLPWLDKGDLEHGDYILGWQDRPGTYRYCHHFDAEEVDRLVASVPNAQLLSRFRADGRTDVLNEYLVLRRA